MLPLRPPGASKATTLSFPYKKCTSAEESCSKVCLCEKCQRQGCKAFTSPSICARKGWWQMSPSTWNFVPKWPIPFWNGDFQPIFARSVSVVKTSEKKFTTSSLDHKRPRITLKFLNKIANESLPAYKKSRNGIIVEGRSNRLQCIREDYEE